MKQKAQQSKELLQNSTVWANPKESKSDFRNKSKTKINPNNPNNPNFNFRIYKRGTFVPLFLSI